MKNFAAVLFAVAVSSADAGNGTQTGLTGEPTDVAKTVSITDTTFACGIVRVEHVYIAKGARRIATYMV